MKAKVNRGIWPGNGVTKDRLFSILLTRRHNLNRLDALQSLKDASRWLDGRRRHCAKADMRWAKTAQLRNPRGSKSRPTAGTYALAAMFAILTSASNDCPPVLYARQFLESSARDGTDQESGRRRAALMPSPPAIHRDFFERYHPLENPRRPFRRRASSPPNQQSMIG